MNTENPSSVSQESQVAVLELKLNEATYYIKHLEEQINWLKKQLFGKKSERFEKDDGQYYLPGFEAIDPAPALEEIKVRVSAHEKRQAKSTPINTITYPDDLPVETVVLDLPEKEKLDPLT
ncbi:MAG: hypothetical protein EB127_18690 [Alphaproteobacteria bacterium]|nr:hypothetical protein [Alphaproteobacteria bacterium]